MRAKQEPLISLAYILYAKAYQENSLILEVLSQKHGRIQILAKGVKKSKKGLSFLLQPFSLLKLQYLFKENLSILVDAENNENTQAQFKDNKVLYSAYYLNELLIRLLPSHEEVDSIFTLYQQTIIDLKQLSEKENAIDKSELILRFFELQLLNELGYEINLELTGVNGEQFKSDRQYYYCENIGFASKLELNHLQMNHQNLLVLSNEIDGECIIQLKKRKQAFFEENLSCKKQIKLLFRNLLNLHLGDKPLKTRELYQQLFVQYSK